MARRGVRRRVGMILAAALLPPLARAAEKDPIEVFFRALDKRDRPAASTVLHHEAMLWKLGEEKPAAAGGSAVLDLLLARFPEFPKWSSKIAARIGAGAFAAVKEGGDVSLLVEKWNARDLPRFLALFEGDVTFFELPSGERLGSGEDAVRERYEKVFENADSPRLEVTERMSLPPWTIYRSRPSMDGEGGDDALTIFQTRDNLVRRVWFVRVGPGI